MNVTAITQCPRAQEKRQLQQQTTEDCTAHWTLAVVVRSSIRERLEAAKRSELRRGRLRDDDAGKIGDFLSFQMRGWTMVIEILMVSELQIFEV